MPSPSARRPEALALALGALARKERTVAELRAWLESRGCDAREIDSAIVELTELGQLDDARFARVFADDKRQLRGWGADRIRAALEARGVAAELVDAALASDPVAAQVERATALLRRRGGGLDDEAARGRALAFLVRRGYDSEIAYQVVRRAGEVAA